MDYYKMESICQYHLIFKLLVLSSFLIHEIKTQSLCPKECSCVIKSTGSYLVVCSNVHYDRVPDISYILAVNIESLEFVNSSIKILQTNAFRGLQIKNLSFHNLSIDNIEDGAFSEIQNLETILLNDNEIQRIHGNVFSSINIHELNLQNNKISFIHPSAFTNKNIQVIDLQYNRLNCIDPELFRHAIKLGTMLLNYNKLMTIPRYFYGETLQIAYNNLTDIPGDLYMPNITVLYLEHNRIKSLDRDSLVSMPRLQWLDLSVNQLSSLPKYLLREQSQLVWLNISHNLLTSLPPDLLDGVQRLYSFDISNNHITQLCPTMFQDLSFTFYISNNPTDALLTCHQECQVRFSQGSKCVCHQLTADVCTIEDQSQQPYPQPSLCVADWENVQIFPSFGPEAGGTVITLSGLPLMLTSLDISEITVAIGELECLSITIKDKYIIARVPQLTDSTLLYTPQDIFINNVVLPKTFFSYRPNPILREIYPRETILRGGTTLTLIGEHLDSVAQITLQVYLYQLQSILKQYNMACEDTEQAAAFCTIPSLTLPDEIEEFLGLDSSNGDTSCTRCSSPNGGSDSEEVLIGTDDNQIAFHLGLGMGGYDEYEDLKKGHPELSNLNVYINPHVETFQEKNLVKQFKPFPPFGHTSFDVHGKRLLTGLSASDFHMVIGRGTCSSLAVTDRLITCIPPTSDPGNLDTSIIIDHTIVQLFIGKAEDPYTIGYLDYQSWWNYPSYKYSLLIGFPILVFILVAFSIYFVRGRCPKKNKRNEPVKELHTFVADQEQDKDYNEQNKAYYSYATDETQRYSYVDENQNAYIREQASELDDDPVPNPPKSHPIIDDLIHYTNHVQKPAIKPKPKIKPKPNKV